MTTLRILLAILFLFAPKLALAGRPCTTCAPVHVAKPVQPFTQNNTYHTYQYVFHNHGVPYAQQGSTAYSAQQVLELSLRDDQASRLYEMGYSLSSGNQQLKSAVAGAVLQQHQDSADAAEFRQFMQVFMEYKASKGGNGNGNGQPLAVQAPQTPLGQLLAQRCVKCHTGQDAKGGVDLSDVDNLSLDVLKAAAKAIRSGKMPKDAPLSAEERMLFCEEYTQRLEAGQ